jgi:hypothetical protein
MRYVDKYSTTGHATDDNTAHAQCMLDNYGPTHTQSTECLLLFHCNTCCTNAAQRYVTAHRLSC